MLDERNNKFVSMNSFAVVIIYIPLLLTMLNARLLFLNRKIIKRIELYNIKNKRRDA